MSSIALGRPYSSLYKYIALCPQIGLFRRFGAFWAKKLHDETSELNECLTALNDQIGRRPELDAKTVLDCPLRIVKKKCPKDQHKTLYDAWAAYDLALIRYGETLCMSQQIMDLPTQNVFDTQQLAEWASPDFRPIFENDVFVPTGEDERTYKGDPDRTDTCAWTTLPRDYLTMRFLYCSRWIVKHVFGRWRTFRHGAVQTKQESATTLHYGRLVGVIDLLSCLLASILLAVTVVVLAIVRPLAIRIALIGIFGTLFAFLLKLMAGKPTRGEVFGATAAFYAVAAVFVGSINNECACS